MIPHGRRQMKFEARMPGWSLLQIVCLLFFMIRVQNQVSGVQSAKCKRYLRGRTKKTSGELVDEVSVEGE